MLRSAFWAVLAVALSSAPALAQEQEFSNDVDVFSVLMGPDQSTNDMPALEVDAYTFLLREYVTTIDAPEMSFVKEQDLDLKSSIWYHVVVKAGQINERVNVPMKHLYAAQGALQALDFVTTISALGRGQNEMNPMFKNGNRSTMLVAKAVASGVNYFAAERIAKRSPKKAMWLMIATNGFMTAVVVNNAAK
jgi:hypothetical protein